ncbi:MAG TPA: branched-chain amino acid aminotransferase [Candidatus Eisenbacteria bacterium]|nr:branched-chain amino acid aminotransferase [Candidatus Eisenbacteria bacterium]
MKIEITKSTNLKEKISDESKLGFGNYFTDHMFVMDYKEGQDWHNPRIIPYQPITVDPSCLTFHYGQTVFEGLKAYRNGDRIFLFRPEENFKRMNLSCDRLCIPRFDEELALQALTKLISLEKDWVPYQSDSSLYIRPFIIADEEFLGVHVSQSYKFMIILSPSGPYYASGLDPIRIYVEEKYVRAVSGGMGEAKTAGNYAASLIGQAEAESKGYSQVLWLDGVERKYVEEVGAMNIFFVIDGRIITPKLNGSILAGITRKSVLELLAKQGYQVEERQISIDEIVEAYNQGKLEEIFGTGTAAVISPVGELMYKDQQMIVNNNQIGRISQKLYNDLTDIQWARKAGPSGWSLEI